MTVSQLADRLVETGHEVQVVTSSAGLPSYHGSEVVRLPGVGPRGRQLRRAGNPDGLRQAVWALALDRHRRLLGTAARQLATGRDWAAATDELAGRHYGAVLGESGLRSAA